jgi:homospermidine synthase
LGYGILFCLINLIGLSGRTQPKEHTMSLTKTTTIDQITVTENGIVLYREATRIMEDGKELSKTYHRSSLTPGQDLTGIPANVVAICNVAWTEAVVAAYQAQLEANRP